LDDAFQERRHPARAGFSGYASQVDSRDKRLISLRISRRTALAALLSDGHQYHPEFARRTMPASRRKRLPLREAEIISKLKER